MPSTQPQIDTQQRRWARYGLNVVVAALVALALVVLVNWIAYRQTKRPQTRDYVRFDVTSGRQFSLPRETRQALGKLSGDFRIVSLLDTGDERRPTDRARDLINEYQRYGSGIAVEHIDPIREFTKYDAFRSSLKERYAEKLKPVEEAIKQGQAAAQQLRKEMEEAKPRLQELVQDATITDEAVKQALPAATGQFVFAGKMLEKINEVFEKAMTGGMPNYVAVLEGLKENLGGIDERLFGGLIAGLPQVADRPGISAGAKDKMLRLVDQLKRSREALKAPLEALRAVKSVEEYDQLMGQLETRNAVVVIGPRRVLVIGESDLFRFPNEEQLARGATPEFTFIGDNKITGALVSMGVENQPMIVFAGSAGGQYEAVAGRLRDLNVQVEMWNPGPRMGPMGQPMGGGGPPPEPKPGQKAVWVVIPGGEGPNPMNPMAGAGEQQVAEVVQKRFEAGDGVLIMPPAPSPFARFGAEGGSPLLKLLAPYGIKIDTGKVVLRQITLETGEVRTLPYSETTDWTGLHSITRPMGGLRGVFVTVNPMEVGEATDASAEVTVLAEVRGADLWAEADWQKRGVKFDEKNAAGRYPVAAAIETKDGDKVTHRAVVVASSRWASDDVVNVADQFSDAAMFPGNGELFVNSVCWLAGLDDMIAATSRAHVVRRVGEVKRGTLIGLRWLLLAGMPVAVLGIGLSVWAVRRKG